jgi:hypothetical protein
VLNCLCCLRICKAPSQECPVSPYAHLLQACKNCAPSHVLALLSMHPSLAMLVVLCRRCARRTQCKAALCCFPVC